MLLLQIYRILRPDKFSQGGMHALYEHFCMLVVMPFHARTFSNIA